MAVVTIHMAQAMLLQLTARAEASEEIVLARGKVPVAKIVSCEAAAPKRQFGALRGIVSVDAAFFDPLPDDERAAWEQ